MYKKSVIFSIIIPVYNTEKYLERCINSILNQTFDDFEIIIVNDCSNGNCGEIINKYNDKRIIYIKHEHNKGTLSARKTGSIESEGEYITYLDPDDELELNALEKIFNTVKDNDYDVIHFNVRAVSLNTNKKERLKEEKRVSWYLSSNRSSIDNDYLMNEVLNEKISHNICGKFFKSNIVKHAAEYIPDMHITFAEDMLQCLIFFYFIKSYKAVYDKLYIYHCDIGCSNLDTISLSKDRFNKICMDSKISADEFYNFLIKMNDDMLYKYDYLKLLYNQYRFLYSKINNDYEYESILNKYFNDDFFKEYNKYEYHHKYYLKTEKKLENINNKLLPYFFSIIKYGFYTQIRIFGIRINIKNNKNYSDPIVITFSNILRILFSIRSSKQNTIINLLGFNFIIDKRILR